jgi:hypothetical protein
MLIAAPCAIAAYLVASPWVTVVLFGAYMTFILSTASIGPAAAQVVTPPELRGRVSAIFVLVTGPDRHGARHVPGRPVHRQGVRDPMKLGTSLILLIVIVLSISALLFAQGRRNCAGLPHEGSFLMNVPRPLRAIFKPSISQLARRLSLPHAAPDQWRACRAVGRHLVRCGRSLHGRGDRADCRGQRRRCRSRGGFCPRGVRGRPVEPVQASRTPAALLKLADLVEAEFDDIALVDTLEMGRPITPSR